MNKKLFDNFIEYYKNEQENDDRYLRRSVLEERDTYRIIQGLSGKGNPITINKLGDFARLLISAQNISFSNGRNWYQDFINSEVATRFMQDVVLQSKELAEIVQEYQKPDWPYEHLATPMEQQHELVEKFINERGREEFRNLGKQIRKIIGTNNDISVLTGARVESELTEYQQQIVAISKMMMRFEGRAPKEDVSINNGMAIVGSIDGAVLIKQTEEEIQQRISEQKSKNKQEINIQFPNGQQIWKNHKLEESDTFKQDSDKQHGWKPHSQQEDKIKKRQAIMAMKWRDVTALQADLSQKSVRELMELSKNIKEMLDEKSKNNRELDDGLINILELIIEFLKEKGSNGGMKRGLTPGVSESQKELQDRYDNEMRRNEQKEQEKKQELEEYKIAMQNAQNIESYVRKLKRNEELQSKQQQSNKHRQSRGMHR